jgi:hypothetical protein
VHGVRPSSRLIALTALVTVVLATGGCSSGGGSSACPTPSAASAADLALLPDALSLEGIATTTRVVREGSHVTAFGVTSLPLEDSTVRLQQAVVAAGYRPAGMDNEGFEAEVFFTAGSYAAGQALLRPADCEGQWDLELTLLDTAAMPSTPAPMPSTPRPPTPSTPLG